MSDKSRNAVDDGFGGTGNSMCSTCHIKNKSVLRNSSEQILDTISSAKKKLFFSKGQLLVIEENASHKIYCINKGKIKIYKTDSNGNQVIIRIAKPGDIIGGEMLMSNDIYDISAMAVEDSIACCINKDVYLDVFKSESNLAVELIKYYETELHRAGIKILKLSRLQVQGKVADALLALYKTYGTTEDKNSIRISVDRQDIANMAGTTKEQVSKALSDLSIQGIIKAKGKRIEFLNLDALRKMADV